MDFMSSLIYNDYICWSYVNAGKGQCQKIHYTLITADTDTHTRPALKKANT